ncbi:unnamed protein product [Candidula unifasciata]|uniref:Ankyrin repeat protein n=1 Tax=Candidula unifasciata TaxID=100452 RepID=A0A8S3Z9K7_9EUPU|nr:unnamed protein product [Candidula unifasciata]
MAFVFHVEFGMNDTALTRALEDGNYATAERLILECPNASYLDDGCYQRTPLYICLCGVDEYHERVAVRNFHLARLLIERGANVNHRVPVTNFGSEYISPGKSSLELLIDFYIELTRKSATEETCHTHQRTWNPMTELIVGLNRQPLLTREDVKSDVQALVFNIIRHGGNVNVLDESRSTVFHRVTKFSHDLSMLKLLYDNGASASLVDASGNTPLLALCNVASVLDSDSYDASPNSESDILQKDLHEDSWKTRLKVKTDFLQYLLKIKDTNINQQNNQGQTALFHSVLREDLTSASMLLEAGADPAIQGYVWESRRKKRKFSPLFASFMSVSLQRSLRHSSLYEQATRAPQPISCLVDAGHFTTKEVIKELSDLIRHDFPEFSHLCPVANTLLHLMFGYKSASLKQLAARKVFQLSLIDSTACLHNILPVSSIQENFRAEDLLSGARKYEEYITLVLNCTVLRRLVQLIQLPQTLLIHLEAQLLYLRMSLKFCSLQAHRSMYSGFSLSLFDAVNGEENALSADDDDGSDSTNSSYDSSTEEDEGGDSDLEYW